LARSVIFGPDSKLPSRVMAQSKRYTEDRFLRIESVSHPHVQERRLDLPSIPIFVPPPTGGRNAVISVHLSGPEFAAATTRWRFRLWRFRFCNWPVTFPKDSDRKFGSCIICGRQRARLVFQSTSRFIRLGAFVIDRLFI